jgi:hypothetical protein
VVEQIKRFFFKQTKNDEGLLSRIFSLKRNSSGEGRSNPRRKF